ncbi:MULTISPECIES: flavodoxin [Bacillaceae]|uniref:Flavodoxin n=1 Tax=Bacillus mesophilum TaxID=1071718 RepID=A0A7V7RKH0_9BACI|nr:MULTISPECIES: flavodoxin [Bacillaceae]KAB2331804.1 flavodoxin [Bacillus mesophilum]
MSNILLIFASMSGNTEEMADLIGAAIKETGTSITIKEVSDCHAQELLNYDAIILGSYTWGDGDLPYEFEDFYDDMEGLQLTGKKAAVFGSGDTFYPAYCNAVDLLIERLTSCGADVVTEGLKVEYAPEGEDIGRCRSFGEEFTVRVKE